MNARYSRGPRIIALVLLTGCFDSTDADRIRPIEQGLCQSGPDSCCPGSPIILDLDGDGFELTDLAGGVRFDLNPNGGVEQISWTAPGSDDAWLALDRNGNGVIDDGAELFGNFTPQPASESRQGYRALAVLDVNHDSVINADDRIFNDLRLWQDRNHDGVSDSEELSRLADHGIVGLDLRFIGSRLTDKYGNLFRYSANVFRTRDSVVGPTSFDVFLITELLDQQARAQGAVQKNGAVSMGLVALDSSSSVCGGDGGDDDCAYVSPPAGSCEGGAALCRDCDFVEQNGQIIVKCKKVCDGTYGYQNGTKCYICPSSLVCSPGPGAMTCHSHIG